MSIQTEDKANFIHRYETAFMQAEEKLGTPDPGYVRLYRAEHIWQPDGTESPETKRLLDSVIGRWFGPDIGGRFEYFDRYRKAAGSDTTAKAIRISAIDVPQDVAVACYIANVDPSRRTPDWSPMQQALHYYGNADPNKAFFFPKKVAASDAGQLTLVRKVNRFLGDLENQRKPLIEIPMKDYDTISPEEWQAIGHKVDSRRASAAISANLKLQAIDTGSAVQR